MLARILALRRKLRGGKSVSYLGPFPPCWPCPQRPAPRCCGLP